VRRDSKTGKVLVVKGDTPKEKSLTTEYTERDDGFDFRDGRILTDRFVPVIRAWDMNNPVLHTRARAHHWR